MAVVALGACGRSGPIEALPEGDGDPDIAGVSVTSPDAVVAPQSTADTEEPASPTSSPAVSVDETVPGTAYIVESGDTLSGIASSFGVSIEALAEANGLADVDSLTPGQQLIIPTRPHEVSVVDASQTSTTPTSPTQTTTTQP